MVHERVFCCRLAKIVKTCYRTILGRKYLGIKYWGRELTDLSKIHPTRRNLVRALLLGAGLTPFMWHMLGSAKGNSTVPVIPGFQKINGTVHLNGKIPALHQPVMPGDVVNTGDKSSAIIIIGQHAYMMRENAEIEFYTEDFAQTPEGDISGVIKIISGAVLSVFGKTDTKISTELVTIGIRGTACYVEVSPNRTYACVCYGKADLVGVADKRLLETVITAHHDAPRYIYAPGATNRIEVAPVINHKDAELRLLESLLNRKPPFDIGTTKFNDSY